MWKLLAVTIVAILSVTLIESAAADVWPSRAERDRYALEANSEIATAIAVAHRMERNQHLRGLMSRADGIFILTSFGRAAYGLGMRGGRGVLLVHSGDGAWRNPAFYDFAGLSIGIQAGISGGHAAFLLMNRRAVDHFRDKNNFALNAETGLSIVNYSSTAQRSMGAGDAVFWTDTAGAYVGADVSITDVRWDAAQTRSFYGDPYVTEESLMRGWYDSAAGDALRAALPL